MYYYCSNNKFECDNKKIDYNNITLPSIVNYNNYYINS